VVMAVCSSCPGLFKFPMDFPPPYIWFPWCTEIALPFLGWAWMDSAVSPPGIVVLMVCVTAMEGGHWHLF
jgi:hypothetical protein